MSTTGENRKPFTSWQRAVVHRPGFLWNGCVAMLAGLAARVHDSCIAGVGTLHAAMLGLFTVADVQGGGEIARGELMRYFAEVAWYPTVLLPSQGAHWEAVDDHLANATLADSTSSLTLLFRFDDAGLITAVHADARASGVGKDMIMLTWDCSVSNYQLRHGMLVPTRGRAAKGGKPYFVGDLTLLVNEFSPRQGKHAAEFATLFQVIATHLHVNTCYSLLYEHGEPRCPTSPFQLTMNSSKKPACAPSNKAHP